MNKILDAVESAREAIANNYAGCIVHVTQAEYIANFDKYFEMDAIVRIRRGNKGDVVVLPYELYQKLKSSHSSTE